MLENKDYCDYDISRELKELGFVAGLGEGDCGYCLYDDAWHDQVNRPLLYEAQKWLREAHNLHIEIIYSPACWTCKIYNLKEWDYVKGFTFIHSFEEALAEGIKAAVKILKEK